MIRIKTMSISGSFGALRQPQDDSAFIENIRADSRAFRFSILERSPLLRALLDHRFDITFTSFQKKEVASTPVSYIILVFNSCAHAAVGA